MAFPPAPSPSKNKDANWSVSIIIPFRNEAENLPKLLKSIDAQEYPKHLFEVILVDDDSEDYSVKTIKKELEGFDCAQPNILIIKNQRKSIYRWKFWWDWSWINL